jgi:aspartyl-tRNA(Asn)/glutamyl-tRNA(Gln) amidotransferase subunit A
MANEDLCYLSIVEASALFASGKLSPVELTQALYDRIDATDGAVHSYVRLMRKSALAEAQASEARAKDGKRFGPLDGIPIAVKDLFDTAGVVTTAGMGIYRERVPTADSTCVRLLRDAGAVILGKVNTHEMAWGGTTNNVFYGATHNPWDLERVPAGSSGGSGSALAAGQALGALGTDTAGSIRMPASFCGITGHKPTFGLVGRTGVHPLSPTLDHPGPMTRSALDAALMLDVLASFDENDPGSLRRPDATSYAEGIDAGVRGLRLAIVPSVTEGCGREVYANFEASLRVLEGLGATVGEVEPCAGLGDWLGIGIAGIEGAQIAGPLIARNPAGFSDELKARAETASRLTVADYYRLLELRKVVERRFEQTLRGEWDAIVMPTTPMVAEPIGDTTPYPDKFRYTSVFDLTHQPAVSVPNGFIDGLPTGLQVAAAQWRDGLALRIAHAYQGATDWHTQRPSL